jgi:hypothetical protein
MSVLRNGSVMAKAMGITNAIPPMEVDGDTQPDAVQAGVVVKTVVEKIETRAMQVGADSKRKDRIGSDPDEQDRGRHRKRTADDEEAPGVSLSVIENMMRKLMREQSEDQDEKMAKRMESAMGKALDSMDDRIDQKVKDKVDELREDVKEDIEEIAGHAATVAKKLEEVNIEYLNFKGEEREWRKEVEQRLEEMEGRMPVSTNWPTKAKTQDEDPWAEAAEAWKTVGSKGKSKGAGKGKEDKKKEEMGRTITIGSYADVTLAEDVVAHLGKILAKEKENGNIEEIFAFGRKRASRGAARFVSSEAMWRYMVAEKGQHRHTTTDGQEVYVSVARREEGEDTEMTKAVRKVVRAVMETMVGEGKHTREDAREELGASYKLGVVKFAGETWATWSTAAKKMEWNPEAKGSAATARRFLELTA